MMRFQHVFLFFRNLKAWNFIHDLSFSFLTKGYSIKTQNRCIFFSPLLDPLACFHMPRSDSASDPVSVLTLLLAGLPQSPILMEYMVNRFLFGCHVTERTYASTDCTGRVGETIKRKGGVSQACLGKSTTFICDIHNMVN